MAADGSGVGRVSRARRLLGGPAVLAHRAALALVAALPAPRARSEAGAAVRILVLHAYGMGGTVRTSVNLAGQLAATRDAELVSVLRLRRRPKLPLRGVRVTVLEDRRPRFRRRGAAALLGRLPSLLVHPEDYGYHACSLWTDVVLARWLRRLPAGVLITTRPALNLLAARLCPPGVAVVGQEHLHAGAHRPRLAADVRRGYGRLAALTVLTEADREAYAALVDTRVERIPNAVPRLGGGRSSLDAPLIVAAGRLTGQKGFDLLLDAFAPLAAEHPAWRLRIHGGGPRRAALERQIARLGLEGRAELAGPTRAMGPALAQGSVFALSSRFEGFGMVIVEAMSKGLPVVSFDCPRGPGEIIEHERDGLLVPGEDVAGMTAALRRLVEDPALRRRLGEGALAKAQAFSEDRARARWERLLAEVAP